MSSTARALRASRLLTRPAAPRRQCIAATRSTRSYASIAPRPAEPKAPEEAEQGSEDLTDAAMNGNFPDPSKISALPLKRQFRDPYGDWWDKQERRNYGEPVHEDNDVLGIFSPEQYTHATPGWAAVEMLCFIGAFASLCFAVSRVYPDKPSAPRTFGDGLEKELGGSGALLARTDSEDKWAQ